MGTPAGHGGLCRSAWSGMGRERKHGGWRFTVITAVKVSRNLVPGSGRARGWGAPPALHKAGRPRAATVRLLHCI